MEYAQYSLAVIFAFALTRYLAEKMKIHLRFSGIWIHHWIIAVLVMIILYYLQISSPLIWGILTGVSLEGLRRQNWSILDKQE